MRTSLAALTALALTAVCAQARPAAVPHGGYPLSCTYAAKDSDEGLAGYARCARREADGLHLAPVHLRRLEFDRRRLAVVAVEGAGWGWAARDGRVLPTLTVDNGPDDFAHGLTRRREGGHIAYFDRRFRRVLATPYDWASPFNRLGHAAVCVGCKPDGTEMGFIVGGRWGEIDRKGRVVIPVELTQADFTARTAREGALSMQVAPNSPLRPAPRPPSPQGEDRGVGV